MPRLFLIVLGLFCCVSTVHAGVEPAPLTFERDIRPILKVYCFDCHGSEEKLSGNLDLRLRRFAVKGGDSGPAIVVGNSGGSLLIERLRAGEMPPGDKKVPPEQIELIARWIVGGAPATRNEPEQLPLGAEITPEERSYWFYQPIVRRSMPQIPGAITDDAQRSTHPDADLIRTPIDAYVLEKLYARQLHFSPDADRLTLIRRATFDLLGLPPSQDEVDAFIADTSPDAYENLLTRLLNSPHYGERWGRHWLDVAGYADSEGNGNDDSPRPHAWHYRDYVIRALNADKPLDQFVIEQLAGDELVPRPWNNLTRDQVELLAATGFVRQAADTTATGGGDQALGSNQVVADALKIVSSSLLGLTVGCAQCHDHKYDPISQADYYRLRAVFEPALDWNHWRRPGERLVSLYTDADRVRAAAIEAEAQALAVSHAEKQTKYVTAAFEKELEKYPEDRRPVLRDAFTTPADKRTPEQKQLLVDNPKLNFSPGLLYQYNEAAANELKADQAKVDAKRAEKPLENFVSVLNEMPDVRPPTRLFYRGDHRQPKQEIAPGDLTIAATDGVRFEVPDKLPDTQTSGRRLAWARHLVNGQHPLVGRVLANRIWMHHFGRGIVDTPGDFGLLGLRPSHPELLDWLATELVREGWSLKRLHRTIMLSTVYRQSSVPRADLSVNPRGVDSDNAFLWHFPVRRLDAEVLRDRMLLVSGRLDRTPYGPPVAVEDDFVGQVVVKGDVPRRSVYLQARRSKPVSFLTAFDAPVMTVNCERRTPSSGAPQALMLMNSDFVLKHAGELAKRVQTEAPVEFARDITGLLRARYPRTSEIWQFGSGSFDAGTQRVGQFAPLPHFTGSAWQGSATLPDPNHGWAIVHASGGHPGGDAQLASIRRWVAPRAGLLSVTGNLKHGSPNGDGVRGRIVSSRSVSGNSGLAGEWQVKEGAIATPVAAFAVEAGDTIDLVVDCIANETSDSYEWIVDFKLSAPSAAPAPDEVWNSVGGFHGPLTGAGLPQQIAFAWQQAYLRSITPEELERACRFVAEQAAGVRLADPKADADLEGLTSLCQQLLSSNEFLYVD